MTVEQAALFLKSRDNFAILTHRRPDGDTLGSAAALCEALRCLGKTAHVVENPEITPRLQPYVKEYTGPLTDSHCTLLSVDVASVSQLPDGHKQLADSVDLFIDHHRGEGFGNNMLVDRGCAACGELVFRLLDALDVPLTPQIALPLYLAVSTDTGCFRYSNTTAASHEIAAKLMATGIDYYPLNFEMFELKTKARAAIEAAMLGKMELSAGGGLCIAAITLNMQTETGVTTDDLDNLSALPHSILGVKIGIMLKEEKPDYWKISIRTSAPYEANKLCAVWGGGGHSRAGGCQITGAQKEVTKMLSDAVEAMYPDYDNEL